MIASSEKALLFRWMTTCIVAMSASARLSKIFILDKEGDDVTDRNDAIVIIDIPNNDIIP